MISARTRVASGIVLVLFLIGLILPAGPAAREVAPSAQCPNNLEQIALALHMYLDDHHCLPPTHLCDREGRPMHSWRVLILPYLESAQAQAVASQYRFDEPWDGPHNRKLAGKMPDLYRCPNSPPNSVTTSYVAVVGPGTTWPGGEPGVKRGDSRAAFQSVRGEDPPSRVLRGEDPVDGAARPGTGPASAERQSSWRIGDLLRTSQAIPMATV